jgi:hypothetical protein
MRPLRIRLFFSSATMTTLVNVIAFWSPTPLIRALLQIFSLPFSAFAVIEKKRIQQTQG